MASPVERTIGNGCPPGALGNLASTAVLQLSGTTGAISNSSGVTISLGTLNVGSAGGTANSNRIGDTTPITLNRGTLRMNAASAPVNEVVGTLSVSGYSILDVQATGANARPSSSI